MPKKESSSTKKNPLIIGGIVIGILMIIASIRYAGQEEVSPAKEEENKTQTMSIYEAQTKCMLMEESDMVNYMGEPFDNATTKKAREFCLSQWDLSKNPNNTEEKFIEIIEADWEQRKNEILEGYTLQQLYNESKGI